jgi:ribosome-binding factor A
MEESKRQKQVGRLIQEEMSDIFQREGMSMADGGMVSISKVAITPDLMDARIYLSLFQVKEPEKLLYEIKEKTKELRKLLGLRVKNQLRRVPELHFFLDDTLDHVFKMEELFRKINEERESRGQQNNTEQEA